LKSGVILAFALVTKKQGLFDAMATKYHILISGHKTHRALTEEEYFDIMENLSIQFYQTGSPNPREIETVMYNDYSEI